MNCLYQQVQLDQKYHFQRFGPDGLASPTIPKSSTFIDYREFKVSFLSHILTFAVFYWFKNWNEYLSIWFPILRFYPFIQVTHEGVEQDWTQHWPLGNITSYSLQPDYATDHSPLSNASQTVLNAHHCPLICLKFLSLPMRVLLEATLNTAEVKVHSTHRSPSPSTQSVMTWKTARSLTLTRYLPDVLWSPSHLIWCETLLSGHLHHFQQ